MALPARADLRLPLLRFAASGRVLANDEYVEHLANLFDLTMEEREQMQRVGHMPVFKNRVEWARFDLVKARLLDSAGRGKVCITPRGREVLALNLATIDNRFLCRYPEFAAMVEASARRRK